MIAKNGKYMKLAQHQDEDFVPFAVESYGGLSTSEISVFASEHLSAWSKEEIVESEFFHCLCCPKM